MTMNTQENEAEVAFHDLFSVTNSADWWKAEAWKYDPMMGEGILQFAERMAKMAYEEGVIEGMKRQRLGIYPENDL